MTYEKRTDRLRMPKQLKVDPSLGREIRMRAEANDRTIQLEILHLIKAGIKADRPATHEVAGPQPVLQLRQSGNGR